MLGVVENPVRTPADEAMEKVAVDMGVGDTFHPTPVGVFFGGPAAEPGEQVADPFFGGVGPDRNACLNCGECMTGCRHNAKNTLVKNYLYLAEQAGAVVHPLTTVTRVRPRAEGGYEISARWTKAKLSRRTAVKEFMAAMHRLTRTTPIVFVMVTDPISDGFVASLAKPGGNITGFTIFEHSLAGKWL